jgi:hypothetical protein
MEKNTSSALFRQLPTSHSETSAADVDFVDALRRYPCGLLLTQSADLHHCCVRQWPTVGRTCRRTLDHFFSNRSAATSSATGLQTGWGSDLPDGEFEPWNALTTPQAPRSYLDSDAMADLVQRMARFLSVISEEPGGTVALEEPLDTRWSAHTSILFFLPTGSGFHHWLATSGWTSPKLTARLWVGTIHSILAAPEYLEPLQ